MKRLLDFDAVAKPLAPLESSPHLPSKTSNLQSLTSQAGKPDPAGLTLGRVALGLRSANDRIKP
jgi:hypothetical protein